MWTGWIKGSLGAVAIAITCTAPAWAESSSLRVRVKEVRNDHGEIRVALWNDPNGFADGDAILVEIAEPARSGEKQITFDNLEPGTYGLVAYHDENANGEFDQNFIGWPAEGLGFSNGAWISILGPPSFDEAAIQVDGPTETIIDLRY